MGIEEDEISKISHARNLSLSVPVYALKNLEHIWQPIEAALPQEYRLNVEVIMQEWIETANELGRPIPEPKSRLMFA